ncbi:MAG: FGLLP motif-containing membrane protein, partial [Rhodoglobus sp.]
AGPAQDSDGREYSVVLPPTIDGLSGGQITSNDAQPTISGTADPFASLDATMGGIPCLTDNGGLFNPIVANAAGNWTCEPNVPMAGDGSYGINVTQTPTWAAAPSPAAVGTYVFDSTPPDQPIITAPANPTVTGDLFQPVSGTGEVGTTVRVRWAVWPSLNATGDYCQSLVDSFGAWSCVPDVARSPGESINVGVFAIDAAGNNSGDYDTNRNLVFLGKPTINGQLGGDTILGNDPTPTFTGTGYPGADIRIQIEGAGLQPECDGVADGAGNWTCTVPSPLTDGDMQYELNTYQSYGGGPETTIYQAYYILDTTVDVPRFTSPVDTTGGGFDYPLFSSVQFPQFTGVAEAGAQVTVEYSVGIGGSPSYSVYCSATADPSGTFACSDGPQLAVGQGYSFAAGQVDPAGNVANAFIPQIDYTVVEPPPAPTLDSPAAGYSAVNPYVFFSGHRNGPFGSPHIYVDGVETCTLVTTEVDFSCTGGPYAPGSHAVQTFLVDDQGTHSTSVFTVFTINAPTLPPGVKAPPVGIAKLVWTLTVTDKDGKDITGKPIKAGDVVFFSSSGLPAGAVVTAVLHSDPIDLGSTVVGADGKFLLKATVPKNAPVGPHNFVVTLTPADQDPSVIEAGVPVEPADEEPAPTKQVDSLTKAEILAMLAAQHPAPVQDGGWNSPTSFSHTLKTVQGIPALLTPVALGITGLVASAFLLLVAFPTELLQSTITENYERVFGWLEPIKRRFARAKAAVARVKINPWLGGTLLVAIAAVILGFSDPGFGFNGASVRLWVALMISLVVMNVAVSAIVMAVSKRRFSIAGALEPLPAALILVAVSVLVSRLLDIQPGFLFAAVLGVAFAGELRKKADGQLALLGVGLTLVIGLAAWALYSALEGDGTGSGFWYLLGQESLAAITVEALATMCISLLPLEFLDGRPIFAWSKVAWALTYIVALVVFVVVVLPLAGNWGEASAPLLGWGAFFLAFAILAVVAWAVLRFRKPKDAKSEA